jgi:hypothetical protein
MTLPTAKTLSLNGTHKTIFSPRTKASTEQMSSADGIRAHAQHFRDLNFWFARCFDSAGEIQNNIFCKEFKMTYTPAICILVSLRPALRMNQCCHTHMGSVDF